MWKVYKVNWEHTEWPATCNEYTNGAAQQYRSRFTKVFCSDIHIQLCITRYNCTALNCTILNFWIVCTLVHGPWSIFKIWDSIIPTVYFQLNYWTLFWLNTKSKLYKYFRKATAFRWELIFKILSILNIG